MHTSKKDVHQYIYVQTNCIFISVSAIYLNFQVTYLRVMEILIARYKPFGMATYFKAVRECLLAVNSQLTIYAKLLLPINFFICVSAFLFTCFSLSIPRILKCSIQVIFEFFIQVAHRYFLRVMIFHHKLPLVLSKQYVIQNSLPYLLQLCSKSGV